MTTTTTDTIQHDWQWKSKTTSRCNRCNEVAKTHNLDIIPDDCTVTDAMMTARTDSRQVDKPLAGHPARLPDGSWGVRLSSDTCDPTYDRPTLEYLAEKGATVKVTTRGGKTWEAQMTRVLTFGRERKSRDWWALVTTKRIDEPVATTRRIDYNSSPVRPVVIEQTSTGYRVGDRCEDCRLIIHPVRGCECTGSY